MLLESYVVVLNEMLWQIYKPNLFLPKYLQKDRLCDSALHSMCAHISRKTKSCVCNLFDKHIISVALPLYTTTVNFQSINMWLKRRLWAWIGGVYENVADQLTSQTRIVKCWKGTTCSDDPVTVELLASSASNNITETNVPLARHGFPWASSSSRCCV